MVVVPADIVAELSSDRPLITATVNGEAYEVRLGSWRKVCYLRLRKDLLRRIGVGTGDRVEISFNEQPEVEAVTEPEVEPSDSPELTSALGGEAFATAWSALPEAHRREYRRWIGGAEESATRTDRVSRLAARLTSG